MERTIGTLCGRSAAVSLLALIVAAPQPVLAGAGDAASSAPVSTPYVQRIEHRLYLAPGVQLGASSQELSLEWWPSGLELAVGGGRGGSRSYGLLQLSYVAGITSRLEAFATFQAPVGESVERPEWMSRWLFGARGGFDLTKPRREHVTRVEGG